VLFFQDFAPQLFLNQAALLLQLLLDALKFSNLLALLDDFFLLDCLLLEEVSDGCFATLEDVLQFPMLYYSQFYVF
jgi:hypothetical protein